jgi:hypothetical protein
MTSERERRRVEFLARAAEADKMAAQAKDCRAKESWKEIADGYRHLAAHNS